MKVVPFIVALAATLPLFAQQPAKFGKVSADELKAGNYIIDTGANAVVLFDVGSTQIKGNKKGWFSLEFKRHRRVHILNKNGYDHASVNVFLFTNGEEEEKLEEVRAVSYNLEGGKVVETKLDKSSIFKEKISKKHTLQKFTLPNVKAGTIIEYEYKIASDFLFNLQPWNFQGDIPVLWSEYKVGIPQFLNYILIGQGSEPFYARDQVDKMGDFWIEEQVETGAYNNKQTEKYNINCGVTQFRWAMKDVPALTEEAGITTLDNYNSRLEFQLSAYKAPITPERTIMNTWPELMADVLKYNFDGELESDKIGWASEAVATILQTRGSNLENAKKIFAYVRDNFVCTGYGHIYIYQPLKDVFKKKAGNNAEINALLTALLRQSGIFTQPVMLSTRDNGYIYPKYPIMGRFNHVITRAVIDDKEVLLDASDPVSGFGILDARCYNGQAKIVDANATTLLLNPDDFTDSKTVKAEIKADASGKLVAKVEESLGEQGSIAVRRMIKTKGEDQYKKAMRSGFGEASVTELNIANAKDPGMPVRLSYALAFANNGENIIYINPMMSTEKMSSNPFVSAKRRFPVEMPNKITDSYQLTFSVPPGYVVDELPKSIQIKLNAAEDVVYEYNIAQTGDVIKLTCNFKMGRARFEAPEYNDLRAFYDKIVAKQNEQIVLKKK
ncbi:MAG TPA: DUF3857 domain-containing protein [Chitinophagaceae bacterium]|jgi:hypothetical protein|nr:DUF3857 domain-containing protein [Chitinophagaceae bacterium]